MTTDHESGLREKAHEAKEKVAEKVEPSNEELRQAGHREHGGSTGDSEAIVHMPGNAP